MSILIIMSITACEEVIDWHPQNDVADRLVVEAILTDEFKYQKINLSGLKDSINGKSNGISGAFVKVESLSESYLFWEDPENPGEYISNNAFAIVPLRAYRLTIDLDQQQYQAIARAVQSLPMQVFPFIPFQESDSVYIGGIGVDYNEVEQAMYEFLIDWDHIIPGDSSQAKQVHYVFSSINIGQLFGPEKDRLVFPKGSIVFKRKYALDQRFAEYMRSLVIETQWKGGFFEESNGDLPTNLNNGALGYFGVCTVKNDTLIAE